MMKALYTVPIAKAPVSPGTCRDRLDQNNTSQYHALVIYVTRIQGSQSSMLLTLIFGPGECDPCRSIHDLKVGKQIPAFYRASCHNIKRNSPSSISTGLESSLVGRIFLSVCHTPLAPVGFFWFTRPTSYFDHGSSVSPRARGTTKWGMQTKSSTSGHFQGIKLCLGYLLRESLVR